MRSISLYKLRNCLLIDKVGLPFDEKILALAACLACLSHQASVQLTLIGNRGLVQPHLHTFEDHITSWLVARTFTFNLNFDL